MRLERDDFSSIRHPALSFCLSMIFFGKPVSTFPDHALGGGRTQRVRARRGPMTGSGAIRRRARLNAVARHYRVLLASCCRRVRRPACDRRFGAIARKMTFERVENAQREAGPDRRTEIKRHPGNLVLPMGNVVRHNPTRAHVTETLERSE